MIRAIRKSVRDPPGTWVKGRVTEAPTFCVGGCTKPLVCLLQVSWKLTSPGSPVQAGVCCCAAHALTGNETFQICSEYFPSYGTLASVANVPPPPSRWVTGPHFCHLCAGCQVPTSRPLPRAWLQVTAPGWLHE